VLAFLLSWGGILVVVGGVGHIPGTAEQTERLFPAVYLAMLVGPSVAGLIMTALVGGSGGLRAFRSRLLRWRVGASWYAIALLVAPLIAFATASVLTMLSPAYRPGLLVAEDKIPVLVFGLLVGLGAGIFEEVGWTGFATPALRSRHGILATGLMVGLPWGAWHFLANLWGIGTSAGGFPLAVFLPLVLLSFLPAYRVLMVWVYDHTGSLLVAMIMHASLTSSLLILQPADLAGTSLVVWNLALGAAMWVTVAIAAAVSHGHPWSTSLRADAA
jgi:membrane protease YdiL (CAAX protease family)